MYIFKNALLSITRNKGRNILIGIIIFVIGLCATITLAIKSSAETLITSYTDAYEVEATISVNRDNLMQNFDPTNEVSDKTTMIEEFNKALSINKEEIEKYGESTYVKYYYYTTTAKVESSTITKAATDSLGGRNHQASEVFNDFSITGYSTIEAMEEFINGTYTITDGEVSADFTSNNCVINSELATINNIKVGDTLTFYNPSNENSTYKLTVTGIYSDNEEQQNNGMKMFTNSANTIITNASFVENMADIEKTLTPTFVLTSKDVIDQFTSEVSEKGLDSMLTISTNLDQVEQETQSISNLKNYATTFLIVTFIIGAVVLFVINMINVRERKYEIGVLRTIGMKKSNLSLQFILETLIVAFFALVLGSGVGAALSVPVANSMLESEIASSNSNMNNINNNFGGSMRPATNESKNNASAANIKMNGQVSVDKIVSINAVVNLTVLGQLLLIGLMLTAISSAAAMISIQRFRPLTILKERN